MTNLDKARKILEEIPGMIGCDGRCFRSCGPIPFLPVEWALIADSLGPLEVMPDRLLPDLTCPFLRLRRCSVYDARPLLCRLWGAVEGMPCEFGCEAQSVVSKDRARGILGRLRALMPGESQMLPPT